MKKSEVLFAEKAAVREYVVNDKTAIEDQDPNSKKKSIQGP